MPDYIENTASRVPCMLVLDASASMGTVEAGGRSRIDLLNEGIAILHQELQQDAKALSAVQIAAINVGGFSDQPQVFLDWTDGVDFQPFRMVANHATPLGAAALLALEAIDRQKNVLRQNGISLYAPWLFIITDGAPTDSASDWRNACQQVRAYQAAHKVSIFPIGVGEADLGTLAQLSTTPPKGMSGVKFRELFTWISGSLKAASRERPDGRATLPSTDPWAAVSL